MELVEESCASLPFLWAGKRQFKNHLAQVLIYYNIFLTLNWYSRRSFNPPSPRQRRRRDLPLSSQPAHPLSAKGWLHTNTSTTPSSCSGPDF